MGLNLFSNSSYDDELLPPISRTPNMPKVKSPKKQLSNPDPKNYKIQRSLAYGHHFIIEVIYPDCTNYEGRKILVYKNTSLEDLISQGSIDPHFSDNENFKSPFARFEPTEAGWKSGLYLLESFPK